jgi:protein AroM
MPKPRKTKIGFLTIGESPRADVVPEMKTLIGRNIEAVEKGALDGLSRAEISRLAPGPGEFSLITRLRSGRAITLGKKKIIPFLQKRIAGFEEEGIGILALLCTDEFPDLESRGIFLRPSRILVPLVASSLTKGRLGVFVPLRRQKREVLLKWKKTGLDVTVEALNPYQSSSARSRAIEKMKGADVDLIVMDCIGYGLRVKEEVRAATGRPVLLPRAVLAMMIKEIL